MMVRTTYHVEAEKPLDIVAKEIAAEQSTGTWTDVPAEKRSAREGRCPSRERAG